MSTTSITFTCVRCRAKHSVRNKRTATNYGQRSNGEMLCLPCCGDEDRERMLAMREGGKMVLYLVHEQGCWCVQNWPGTLSLPVRKLKK